MNIGKIAGIAVLTCLARMPAVLAQQVAVGIDANVLLEAIDQEDAARVRQLLAEGADVSKANREGMIPLALAASTGNEDISAILLDAGAQVDQTLRNGETPLMMASRTGDIATIQLLLDHGANINAKENLRGTTPLMWAAVNKRPDAIKALLANDADTSLASAITPPGRSPRLSGAARSRVRSFYTSLVSGDPITEERAPTEDGISGAKVSAAIPREQLLRAISPELVEEFRKDAEARTAGSNRGPGAARQQWGGLTALHFAVREGDLASVKVLVEGGADVNQTSEYDWSPLLVATQNRYYQMGKYLLEHGADPNIVNGGGWNPLYIATDNRNIEGGDYPTRKPDMDHLEYIKLLLDAGADPNIRMESSTENRTVFTNQWLNEAGATPFLRAAQSSDLELMKLLLDQGADPRIYTREDISPLMVASGIGWVEGITYEWSEEANRETLKLLLDLGADPNVQDLIDMRTALMGAGHKGRGYAVQMLVDAGADLAARDIGSRDTINNLTGVRWQAIDYANGLVRIGVQSAVSHPDVEALLRKLMLERGLEVPEEGRTLDSICIVDVCK